MKCPNCQSLMTCESEIHQVPHQPGRERMDLHCIRRCGGRCHMGVITEDPKEWICHEYNFSFYHKNRSYHLYGHDKLVDPYNQHRKPDSRKTVLSNIYGLELVTMDFVPITTGDDMHLEAWNLFHRLRNLVIFS